MTFKNKITKKCEEYARNPMARFIGYNTVYGSRMYGTLNGVSVSQCIESPVAENLMVGLSMGLSLESYRPVLCFERHDFILLALDALVNQMDKMPWMSGDKFKYSIVVRAIVGGKSPIDPGPMHSQNYTKELSSMLKNTVVLEPMTANAFDTAWDVVGRSNSGAVVIIEHKDLYETELL